MWSQDPFSVALPGISYVYVKTDDRRISKNRYLYLQVHFHCVQALNDKLSKSAKKHVGELLRDYDRV